MFIGIISDDDIVKLHAREFVPCALITVLSAPSPISTKLLLTTDIASLKVESTVTVSV